MYIYVYIVVLQTSLESPNLNSKSQNDCLLANIEDQLDFQLNRSLYSEPLGSQKLETTLLWINPPRKRNDNFLKSTFQRPFIYAALSQVSCGETRGIICYLICYAIPRTSLSLTAY